MFVEERIYTLETGKVPEYLRFHSLFTCDLQYAVQSSRDRVCQREVVIGRKSDRVTGSNVRSDNRTDGDSRVSRLGGSEHRKECELLAFGEATTSDRDR